MTTKDTRDTQGYLILVVIMLFSFSHNLYADENTQILSVTLAKSIKTLDQLTKSYKMLSEQVNKLGYINDQVKKANQLMRAKLSPIINLANSAKNAGKATKDFNENFGGNLSTGMQKIANTSKCLDSDYGNYFTNDKILYASRLCKVPVTADIDAKNPNIFYKSDLLCTAKEVKKVKNQCKLKYPNSSTDVGNCIKEGETKIIVLHEKIRADSCYASLESKLNSENTGGIVGVNGDGENALIKNMREVIKESSEKTIKVLSDASKAVKNGSKFVTPTEKLGLLIDLDKAMLLLLAENNILLMAQLKVMLNVNEFNQAKLATPKLHKDWIKLRQWINLAEANKRKFCTSNEIIGHARKYLVIEKTYTSNLGNKSYSRIAIKKAYFDSVGNSNSLKKIVDQVIACSDSIRILDQKY